MTDAGSNRPAVIAPGRAMELVAAPWVVVSRKLRASFDTGSMTSGTEFVRQIVAAAERAGHHPDVELRYRTVSLTLTTWSADGLTDADLRLAAEISEIADRLGHAPSSPRAAGTEIAIDAMDIPRVMEFWRATFGLRTHRADPRELSDPTGALPLLWFQQMDVPRPDRNRIHLDVWVDPAEVDGRIAAALAAGGTLLSDREAPSFWVLADPEGNEVCLCTGADRGPSES